jgi:hypothetical protein
MADQPDFMIEAYGIVTPPSDDEEPDDDETVDESEED